MRALSLLILAGLLLLPLWLFSQLVMPEINALQDTYSHMDEIAANAAGAQ